MNNSIQVRELDNLQDQDFGRNIFDITWSMDAGTEITPNLLQAMVHSGSYLSGAFINNKIVGAAFAFPATNGGLHVHSHMTAVLPEFRDNGVGYSLKIDQWNWAKKNHYSHLSWTFDPTFTGNGAKIAIITPGQAADKARLTVGMIVKSIDGFKVNDAVSAIVRIRSHAPGDQTIMVVETTTGVSKTFNITLGSSPALP